MTIESVVPIVIPGTFLFFVLAERLRPARPLPRVRGWRLLGVASFLMTGVISSTLPLLYADFARAHRLFDLERLGTVGGAMVALLGTDLVTYWFHRLRHRPVLWRLMHQMHHSAERLDTFGSSFFHPFDIAGETVVSGLAATMLLGVSPEGAALAGLISVFLSIFQHSNLRTPRWLGYLVQRPESHSIHHARGVHAFNYANLPVWDLVFGTFRNAERFEPETGFYDGASRRLGEMLVFRDVSRPPA
jgi:sterol desaturase/sphingolipid hydroxylase (fatty acid hydroxylase superfamily)